MTVSANSSLDFQRDQLLRMSYQLTGLLEAGREPSAADLSMAADFMNLELMALQADGVILRTIERATLTLTSGTAQYTLPSDTIDVQLGPNDQFGSIIPASGGETLVTTMSRAEYLDLSDKTSTTTGRPTRAYLEKQATVTVTLWPVPDASAVSLRYSRVRLLRDVDTGAVTLDLARRWLKFVTYATAVHVGRAKSISNDNIKGLEIQADRLKKACLADDNQRGKVRYRLTHVGRHWLLLLVAGAAVSGAAGRIHGGADRAEVVRPEPFAVDLVAAVRVVDSKPTPGEQQADEKSAHHAYVTSTKGPPWRV